MHCHGAHRALMDVGQSPWFTDVDGLAMFVYQGVIEFELPAGRFTVEGFWLVRTMLAAIIGKRSTSMPFGAPLVGVSATVCHHRKSF